MSSDQAMKARSACVLLLIAASAISTSAFSVLPTLRPMMLRSAGRANACALGLRMEVKSITSEPELDAAVASAGPTLVIVDYSTTWCGPCKIVAPKYEALSEKYPQAIFYKCIGDATPDATKLMKREGIRSVPAFHFWKNGARVEVIAGANVQAIETAIKVLRHNCIQRVAYKI